MFAEYKTWCAGQLQSSSLLLKLKQTSNPFKLFLEVKFLEISVKFLIFT